MIIEEMIKELCVDINSAAKRANITPENLRSKITRKVKVEKLASGDYVTVRKDAVYFKGDSDEQLKHKE